MVIVVEGELDCEETKGAPAEHTTRIGAKRDLFELTHGKLKMRALTTLRKGFDVRRPHAMAQAPGGLYGVRAVWIARPYHTVHEELFHVIRRVFEDLNRRPHSKRRERLLVLFIVLGLDHFECNACVNDNFNVLLALSPDRLPYPASLACRLSAPPVAASRV